MTVELILTALTVTLAALVFVLWMFLQRLGATIDEFGKTIAATNRVLTDAGYGDDSQTT